MTPIEFETRLDQYGSNLEHWPKTVRDQASIVIREKPQLKKLLYRQAAIENELRVSDLKAPSYLKDKILGQIEPRESMDLFVNWLSFSLARTAIALLLPIATGMSLGSMMNSEEPLQSDMDTISYTQYLLESENEI
jgi:hypothetical protein